MIGARRRDNARASRCVGTLVIVVCTWCGLLAGGAAANSLPVLAYPQVASDPTGDVVAVWWADQGNGTAVVRSAWRPAGGAWQDPVDVSGPSRFVDDEPRVAISASGEAVAVWDYYNGSHHVVQATRRPAGAGWQAPVDISPAGHNADEAEVAINAAGLAVAVWRDYSAPGPNPTVQTAWRPAGGAWQPSQPLSDPNRDAERPQVALNASGRAVAVWESYVTGGQYPDFVQAAARPAGGNWSAPVNVSAPSQGCCLFPKVALDGAGTAVAAWERVLKAGSGFVVEAAARPAATGTWQVPATLSAAGRNAFEQEVAFSPTGAATVVWSEWNGSTDVIRAATRPVGGPFGAPVNVSAASQEATRPQLAIASSVTVAVWEQQNSANSFSVQAAASPAASGVWQPQVNLSAPGQNTTEAHVAVDSAGDTVAVWERTSNPDIIEAASRPATSGLWQAPYDISLPSHPAVPDVLEEFSKTSAAQALTAVDLVPRFVGATTAPNSYVITETPAPGTIVPQRTLVTLRLRACPRICVLGPPGSNGTGTYAKAPGQARAAVAARRP